MSEPPNPDQIYKMQDGILHEDDMRARLILKGIRFERPGSIIADNVPVVLHPDDIFTLDGVRFGVEFKSYDCDYFHALVIKGIKDYSPKYYRQVQLYMHYTGIKQWVLLAKDRNCCQLHEEIIRYDQECVAGLIDAVLSAKAVLDQNLDCQVLPCSNEFMTRLFCPFKVLCEGPTEEIFSDVASKAAESWLWAKKGQVEFDREITVARQTFRDILTESGLPKIDVSTWFNGNLTRLRIYAYGSKRHVADTDLARQVLGPDFNRVFPLKEFEGPRIFRLKDEGNQVSDEGTSSPPE